MVDSPHTTVIEIFFLLADRYLIMERYDVITREMKIPQELVLEYPSILLAKTFALRERLGFLKSLGRAQYDKNLPLYVPLDAIKLYTNEEFAEIVAGSTYEKFDAYLRTI